MYLPVEPFRGAVAKTFWGKAWCTNLEAYGDYANRMPRGRSYVRNGAVMHLNISRGEIQAIVMGSSAYQVEIQITPVSVATWQAIGKDCSGSIDSMIALLQGKLSRAVMERICAPSAGLFPSPREITMACSCPDYAGLCKHLGAVLYGVGTRLDQQPELLFSLRGVDAKNLIAQAGKGGLSPGKSPVAKAKVLADDSLADVFGLEMAEWSLPVVVASPKHSQKKGAAKDSVVKKEALKRVIAKAVVTKPGTVKKSPLKKAAVKKVASKNE
jgi:uncharacterized Zn finger protein